MILTVRIVLVVGNIMANLPKWKQEHIDEFEYLERKFKLCIKCTNLGTPIKMTTHKDKGKYAVYKCSIHGCLCTQFSLSCKDYKFSPGWLDRQDIESPY